MPKIKKQKKDTSSDSDSGPDDKNPPPAKKGKPVAAKPAEGLENEWTLEKMRKVRVNEFRGRKMVDIREYYEKDGEVLPGKKGISLSISQWKKLVEIVNEVNSALEE